MEKNVNELYESICSENVPLEIASKTVIEYIYNNANKYGMFSMNEDEKSDFIIYLYERMDRILLHYCKNLSSFSTYLLTVTLNFKKTWFKKYYHKRAKSESVKYYYHKEVEYCLNDSNATYLDNIYTELEYSSNNLKKNEALAILVLALKSCYYLTEYHIEMISKRTGYSKEKIQILKEQLENLIRNKIDKNNLEKERINSAYIKKNSCLFELMYMKKDTPIAERLIKNYYFYTKSWKQNIERLHNIAPIRPSNAHIAGVLGIKEHVVNRLLHEIKNNKYHSVSL